MAPAPTQERVNQLERDVLRLNDMLLALTNVVNVMAVDIYGNPEYDGYVDKGKPSIIREASDLVHKWEE